HYRSTPEEVTSAPLLFSDFLCRLAPHVSSFITDLFGPHIKPHIEQIRQNTLGQLSIFTFKERFIKRRVLKHPPPFDETLAQEQGLATLQRLGCTNAYDEKQVASLVVALLEKEEALKETPQSTEFIVVQKQIHELLDYFWAQKPHLKKEHGWLSFDFP